MTTANHDEVRTNILLCLYEIHQSAKTKKNASVLISELQRLMKLKHGYKQQEVASNLDYLVQIQWVVIVTTTRAVPLPSGTTIDRSRETYKISALGIDKVQGASLYKAPMVGGINIQHVSGVVVTGDGNVVNQSFSEAAKITAQIRSLVDRDAKLPADQKLGLLSDLDSFSAQMQKPSINRPLLHMLWDGIQSASTIAGAADLLHQLGGLIQPYLAG